MNDGDAIRARILNAVVTLLSNGTGTLTQAKVAAMAGLRQSHLQYYFPKRLDLIAALLRQHIDMAADRPGPTGDDTTPDALHLIANDPARMRFFLGLVMEADREPALRDLLSAHIRGFQSEVAQWFGEPAASEGVRDFLNCLRGHGMMALATGGPTAPDLRELAGRFGLTWPSP